MVYKLKIKELPVVERPRERLINSGPNALSDAELLAIVISKGTYKENVLDMTKRLLKKYNLGALSQITVSELKGIFGIGEAKACQIIAAFELGKRLASYTDSPSLKIESAADVVRLCGLKMRDLKKEHLKGFYLNSRKRLIKSETISIGSLDANLVHPREIFKTALAESAAGVILVHNHPSGNPTPSEEDIAITRQIAKAGKIMGIELLDHIIVSSGGFVSLMELGVLK
ncbi:MAG: DNA repair protein RadC [Candidatus Nanoarchaeia archaeon]